MPSHNPRSFRRSLYRLKSKQMLSNTEVWYLMLSYPTSTRLRSKLQKAAPLAQTRPITAVSFTVKAGSRPISLSLQYEGFLER